MEVSTYWGIPTGIERDPEALIAGIIVFAMSCQYKSCQIKNDHSTLSVHSKLILSLFLRWDIDIPGVISQYHVSALTCHFICVLALGKRWRSKTVSLIYSGLGDDQEFCLVKRILGKNGCNMREILKGDPGAMVYFLGSLASHTLPLLGSLGSLWLPT